MTAPTAVPMFASLTELQEQHAVLVKEVGTNTLALTNLKQIDQFVRRGLATGTILDASADRDAAQSLITFWINRLRSSLRFAKEKPLAQLPEFEDTLLAEFKPDDLIDAVVPPANAWLNRQSPTDQTLARRLVLRLVSLQEDGSFHLLPSVREISEELVPQDQAERVLQELVGLGVVRKTRDSSGHMEYALRSEALLQRWSRLREWTDERRQFRQQATAWAQKRADKAAHSSEPSFWRRVEKAGGVTVRKVGARIESAWRAVFGVFNIRRVNTEILTEEQYKDAETYRDKNAVELKLVYQKRQLDKEREERRHIRAVVSLLVAIVFAILSGIAFWGWTVAENARKAEAKAKVAAEIARENEAEARKRAETAEKAATQEKKRAHLEVASWQLTRGAELLRADAPGALVWYTAAWSKFTANADVLPGDEAELLKSDYLLRLGVTKRQLPVLTAMAFQRDGLPGSPRSVATVSADGKVALTAGIEQNGKELSLVVKTWRAPGRGPWKSEETRLLLTSDQPSPNRGLGAYLSPDGQTAVIALNRDEGVTLRRLTIPKDGSPNWLPGPTSISSGVFTDAKFSPDGRYFGLLTFKVEKTTKMSTVSVWEVAGWERYSLPQADPYEGTLGVLAFAPPGTPARVAAVLGSDSPKTLCLEWTLDKSKQLDQPKRYGHLPENAQRSVGGEVLYATYGPPGQDLLFVARGSRRENFGSAWIFDTQGATQDQEGEPLDKFRHWGPITSAAFNPNGDRLATGSLDGGVVLWRLPPKEVSRRPEAVHPSGQIAKHAEQVFQTDFSPDGQYIVTASRDQRALIWDATTGQLVLPLHHSGSVTDAKFTESAQVVTVSQSAVYRWELPRTISQPLLLDNLPSGAQRTVTTESLSQDGRIVVLGGWIRNGLADVPKGWVRAWKTTTGVPSTAEFPHDSPVRHVAVSSQDPLLICTTTDDGTVRIWNEQGLLWTEPACEERAIFTAFGVSEKQLKLLVLAREYKDVMAGRTSIRVHTLGPTGKEVGEVQTTEFDLPLTAAVFSPNCERVAAYAGDGGDGRGLAVVWELRDGKLQPLEQPGAKPTERMPAHQDPITHAAFSRDGLRLVTTSRDDTATVWVRSETGWTREELRGELDRKEIIDRHTADVNFASFDNTGDRVVTGSADGSAVVWERVVEEGRYRPTIRFRPELSAGGVTQAMFINPRFVLTASNDRTVRVWDTTGARRVVVIRANLPSISTLRYREEKSGTNRVIVFGREESWARSGTGPVGQPGASSSQVRAPQFIITEWSLDSLRLPLSGEFTAVANSDLLAVAELTAARRISTDDPSQTIPLTLEEADKRWKQVEPRLTFDTLELPELLSWHFREAIQCEFNANWRGALWHWEKLLAGDHPGDRRRILLCRCAHVRAELRDWVGAEKDLQAALEGPEQAPEIVRALAKVRVSYALATQDKDLKLKKINQAIEDYRLLLTRQDDYLTRLDLAEAYLDAGNPASAIEQVDKLPEPKQPDPDLLLRRADILRKLGEFKRAYADYLAAGRLFKMQQRLEQAVGAYHAAIKLFKEGSESSSQVQAKIHSELGEVQLIRADRIYQQRVRISHDACTHFLEATKLDNTVWEYWNRLAQCHERLREWKEARQAYEKAIDLNPKNPALVISHAGTLVQLKDWDAAAKAYQRAIELAPKNLSHRLRLAAIYLQPTLPENNVSPERVEAALHCLIEATKDPDFSKNSLLWLRLAAVQLKAGKIADYQATRAHMLELFKDPTIEAANNIAWASALANDTPEGSERALKLIEKAVSASPRNAAYLNTYGAVLYRAGRAKDAISQLRNATKQRAQTFHPPDQLAYGNASDLLFIALSQNTPEQRELARESLKSALEIIKNFGATQQSETPEESLLRVWNRLEIEIIASEAKSLVDP